MKVHPGICAAILLASGCLGSPDAPDAAPGATRPAPDAHDPGWPTIEEARIRPGIEITYIGPIVGQEQEAVAGCTSNFLFRSPDNQTLYLGTAAHCTDGLALGDPVAIGKGVATGTLAYSSFLAMEDVGEEDDDLRDLNDFALLRIEEADRALAHPAVLHWGGPVGLANSGEIPAGARLLAYGNTDLRPHVEESNRHEGCLAENQGWALRTYWLAPTMGGDSGSPVLAASGEALGVHRGSFLTLGERGLHEEVALDLALAYAREKAGFAVELATWPLLAGPAQSTTPCEAPTEGLRPDAKDRLAPAQEASHGGL